jgi:arylsulfatase A-like enzyme
MHSWGKAGALALTVLCGALACRDSGPPSEDEPTPVEATPADAPPAPALRKGGVPAPEDVRATLEQGQAKLPSRDAPSILLITIDTLRKRNVHYFGYPKSTTPNIDSLLEQSRVFDLQTAAPWTVPSLASLLTGLPFSVHQAGVIRTAKKSVDSTLRPDVVTLAEALQKSGYLTCAFVTNGHLLDERKLGFRRGFDYYYSFGDKHPAKPVAAELDKPHDWPRVRSINALLGGDGERLLKLFRAFASKEHARGTFFWVHLFEPHNPFKQRNALLTAMGQTLPDAPDGAIWMTYDLRKVFRNGEGAAPQDLVDATRVVYDGEVAQADILVGGFREHFEAVAKDGWIALTADHGEELFERGSVDHGHTLYQELLDSFLLLYSKSQVPRREEKLARHVDVYPTLCNLARAECPDPTKRAGAFGGLDLLSRKEAPPALSENPELFEDRVAVRAGNDKLILHLRSKRYELYDLRKDPGELYAIHDDTRAAPLLRSAEALVAQRTEARTAQPPSRELEERLRALGYAR